MKAIFLSLLVILIFISGFLSLAQIALFSLSHAEVRLYKTSMDLRRQLIARLLSRPRDLLVTILMCDITVNILAQNAAANLFGDYSSWLLKVGVPLVLTLLLGEVFPKTLALPNNARIAYRVAPAIDKLERALGPIRTVTTTITSQLSKMIFFFLRKEEEISKEELHHVLKTSEKHGILSLDEADLVDGYLSLTDYTVKERMRPRDEILYYDIQEPLSKLTFLFTEQECSRVPVCKEELQNILGVISAKTFFLRREEIKEPADLLKFLRKPVYVPETILARTLLRKFLFSEQKMGIVVDEYGSVAGLITQEDLFEVVIGEILDRKDESEIFTTSGKDTLITSGKFELAAFEDFFGVSLPSENNMVTIGGWLTEKIGDIPKSGAKFTWKDFVFQILTAEPNRIKRVYIRRLKGKNDAS